MEYKYLGPTGLKVSVIGLGSGVLTDDPAQHEGLKQVVKKAFESGINFFDTAEMYGYGQSELALGKAFKELGLPREQLVVSTKIFWGPGNGPNDNGLSRKHLIEGTKASLKRLQLDYVDLLFCHKPDYQTPVEETVRAIDFLIQKGWILYWGTSEWPVERIMEAHRICEKLGIQKPVVEQPEYNMLNRYKLEKEYLQLFNEAGLGTTVWSPMAGGVLSGKYNDGIPEGTKFSNTNKDWQAILEHYLGGENGEKNRKIFKGLAEIAKEIGCTQAQLAYAWVLKNPNVTVCLLGATKVTQLEENLKAIELTKKLTPEVMERINKVLNNAPQGNMDFKNWKPFT